MESEGIEYVRRGKLRGSPGPRSLSWYEGKLVGYLGENARQLTVSGSH